MAKSHHVFSLEIDVLLIITLDFLHVRMVSNYLGSRDFINKNWGVDLEKFQTKLNFYKKQFHSTT